MKPILFLVFFLFCQAGFSQHPELKPFFSKTEKWQKGQFVGKDNFGNFYSIYENEFQKHVQTETFFYKNVALGKIHQADLQNPLQIVLFYKQFTTVVLLDNQLNETARINFSELEKPLNPEAVSLASQNRLWIYDMLSQKLGLFDIKKNTFQPITPPFSENVLFYQSDYNYFYWVDTKQNFYTSDLFGKVSFLGKLPEFDQLQVVASNRVLLQINKTLYLYNLETEEMSLIALNEKTFDSFSYKDQILSIFTLAEINQYKITLP